MHMAPAELLLVPPLSTATSKLMGGYASTVPGLRCEQAQPPGTPAAALAAMQAWYDESGSTDERGTGAALQSLPPLALVALAAALHYLKPLGMASVLGRGATFRPFSEAAHVRLSSNALRCGGASVSRIVPTMLTPLDHTCTQMQSAGGAAQQRQRW